MRNYHYILVCACMILLPGVSGCSSEHNIQQTVQDGRMCFRLVHPSAATSRVNESGFEVSDSIGLFITEGEKPLQPSSNYVNNELLIYNGSTWEPNTLNTKIKRKKQK